MSAELSVKKENALALKSASLFSLRLLQMSASELNDFIRQELESNPFLKRDDNFLFKKNFVCDAGTQKIDPSDIIIAPRTLREFLHEQIIFTFSSPRERLIAVHLAEYIDDAGYFTGDLVKVAGKFRENHEKVQDIFSKMQDFEPLGIFSCDLAGCLYVQLKDRGELSLPMEILLKNLHLLAECNYSALAHLCNVSEQDVFSMRQRILRLNPKPAASWIYEDSIEVIPDAFVVNSEESFRIRLNTDILPALARDCDYSVSLSGLEEDNFLLHYQKRGNWLINALERRTKTLLKLIRAIMRRQRNFLYYGKQALQPLKQEDIADDIHVTQGTVSRAISGKYINTPAGVFPLSYFFISPMHKKSGDKCCSGYLAQMRIDRIIKEESACNILSDSDISRILQREGIWASRRLVTNYRNILHIPPADARRRIKEVINC